MAETCPNCGWSPPRRLTATPAGKVTVWVAESKGGGELLLRPHVRVTNHEAASDSQEGWVRLSRREWESVRDCVDRYFDAVATSKEQRESR
jgi:hypothetical protein